MNRSKFEHIIKSTNVRNINFNSRILNKLFITGNWVYPKMVTDFVRKKFFTPHSKPLNKVQETWIGKSSTIKIQSRGKDLAVWKVGKGPSILFIHGWNGAGVQFHRFFQPTIDAGFSVVFFDAPAHGLSEGDTTNYLEITESLDHLFNSEIGKDIVGIVAHSLGTSAIINHMSRHHSSIPMVLVAAAFRLLELLFANFQLHGVPKSTYLQLLKEVEDDYGFPLETQNPIDLIKNIKNEVLIIHDKKDRTTPVGPSRIVAVELDNVEIVETEGLGHSLLLKNDDVIYNALNFIISKRQHSKHKLETMEV